MKKTVTRTYRTKKGIVSKTYVYDTGTKSTYRSRRGKTLVGKNGKINKKNIEAYKREINESTELSSSEKRAIIADLEATVKQRHKNGSKLTESGFEGHRADTKLERLFANLGYTAEELADAYDIEVADLMKDKNWKEDTLTIGKRKFRINWTYTGNVLEEI